MGEVEKIQDAEAKVAAMQEALAEVQSGLERAERIAAAAEETKERAEQLLKVTVGLIGVAVVLIFFSRRQQQ